MTLMLVGVLLAGLLGAVPPPVGQGIAPPVQLAVGAPTPLGTVTAFWDANTDGVTTGYLLYYGLVSSAETEGVIDTGLRTSAALPASLLAGRRYFFHVRAYAADGTRSPSSVEITYDVPADACAFPLGATSVSVFITGKLNKTGSGGPGSRAFITFQAASPNSPIVFLAVRANGTDIPDSVIEGVNLRAVGSAWFTIPPLAASYAIYGRNAAGCSREQPTGFSTTGP